MTVTQMLKPGKTAGALTAMALSLVTIGGFAVSAAPAAEAKPIYSAVCSGKVWTDKDPSTCTGQYTLYDINAVRPLIILQVNNGKNPDWRDMWRAVKRGDKAVNSWCSSHSFTCTVVTGVGIAVAAPLVNAVTG